MIHLSLKDLSICFIKYYIKHLNHLTSLRDIFIVHIYEFYKTIILIGFYVVFIISSLKVHFRKVVFLIFEDHIEHQYTERGHMVLAGLVGLPCMFYVKCDKIRISSLNLFLVKLLPLGRVRDEIKPLLASVVLGEQLKLHLTVLMRGPD
jgi:hypothetical protein